MEGGSRLVHISEGVDMYHVLGEVVCPLEDLRSDVHKEGVGGPPPHHFDLLHRNVHQKESHCCAGSDGFGSDVGSIETKGRFAALGRACRSHVFPN